MPPLNVEGFAFALSSRPMRRLPGLASLATVSPPTVTVPRSGLTMPQIIATVVDLPAPLGPSRPTISPRPAMMDTPATAGLSPKDLQRSVACSMGAPDMKTGGC